MRGKSKNFFQFQRKCGRGQRLICTCEKCGWLVYISVKICPLKHIPSVTFAIFIVEFSSYGIQHIGRHIMHRFPFVCRFDFPFTLAIRGEKFSEVNTAVFLAVRYPVKTVHTFVVQMKVHNSQHFRHLTPRQHSCMSILGKLLKNAEKNQESRIDINRYKNRIHKTTSKFVY